MLRASLISLGLFACLGTHAQANEFKPMIDTFFAKNIQGWLTDPMVINAIKAQNTAHVNLNADDIQALDQQWRAEEKKGGGALIDKVLATDLSKYLSDKKAGHANAITEMFVMDNKGLNVGQSDITSDYFQGDEDKWQKTFGTGGAKIFVDEVEYDDSSKSFQSQISATIVDPATNTPVGAITVGLNVERLL